MSTQIENKFEIALIRHEKSSKTFHTGDLQEIKRDYTELGRDSSCAICFGDNFPTVSRRHAAIIKSETGWQIKNLSQTNPTYVNGRPVKNVYYLSNGDQIKLSTEGPLMTFILKKASRPTQIKNSQSYDDRQSKNPSQEPIIDSKRSLHNETTNVSTKKCQFCNEHIISDASVCKHCQREQLSPKEIKEFSNTIANQYWPIIFLGSLFLGSINPWWILIGLIVGSVALHYYGVYLSQSLTYLELFNRAKKIKKNRKNSWYEIWDSRIYER